MVNFVVEETDRGSAVLQRANRDEILRVAGELYEAGSCSTWEEFRAASLSDDVVEIVLEMVDTDAKSGTFSFDPESCESYGPDTCLGGAALDDLLEFMPADPFIELVDVWDVVAYVEEENLEKVKRVLEALGHVVDDPPI